MANGRIKYLENSNIEPVWLQSIFCPKKYTLVPVKTYSLCSVCINNESRLDRCSETEIRKSSTLYFEMIIIDEYNIDCLIVALMQRKERSNILYNQTDQWMICFRRKKYKFQLYEFHYKQKHFFFNRTVH